MAVTDPTAIIAFLLVGGLISKGVAYYFFRQRRRLREVLRLSIEAMDEGFILYDSKDRLVMWNERGRLMHSPSAQKVGLGTDFETILRLEVADGHFLDAKDDEEAWVQQRLEGHRTACGIEEERLSNGRYIRITKDRTPEGYLVSLILDVTSLKMAQQAAEASNKAKSDMLRNISHELRTPLTVVFGHSSILSHAEALPATRSFRAALGALDAGDLDRQFSAYTDTIVGQGERIRNSSQHLLDLVNEILDLARIEGGHMEIKPDLIPADTMLDETLAEFRGWAKTKGIALHRLPTDATIYADPMRLKQIAHNLLGNAIKFTDHGTITLTAETHGDGTWLSVADTGCGIADDDHKSIFESFHQVDASDARRQKGSGLGLALTKSLVELHGGTITLRSAIGAGSTFEVFFPAPAPAMPAGGTSPRDATREPPAETVAELT
ncbi:His Kinase A (phospho-acceptor) domain-containing protein [Tranquillimonas rosea]|uniref:histidine kinase n=1 Tax=Tranquillimonas rosea TaxID=641238 RepID=A0A1H9WR52_9RHOB|nr:ATP-binding protein [Tranquillimonas rosea]SES36412.1 His Kinase A (phospho-acceptor) domain-containing protein [Tranquillimonas rosea]